VAAYHSSTEPLSPYDDANEVLSVLAADYRLGLITDGREGEAKLDRLDIRDYFDAVLVTPTVGRSKHHPEVFDRVLSTLSVPPSDAVYVGDDPRVDFRVPNDMGMRTVRLRRGRYTDLDPADDAAAPDREVEGLIGLLRYL
jgi:putative hydrolase of the HAD superfamily